MEVQLTKRNSIPHKPGVYLFKDVKSRVIYVGKAVDLRKRVASYFKLNQENTKTALLVGQIKDIETIVVESELEALVLEANLIKKFRPHFNVRLMDDKDYLYICVTKGDFPAIKTARKQDLDEAKQYFGPFPSSAVVKSALKRLRHIFPWCATPTNRRPCFYYHLGLCPGPCAGMISKPDYQKIIRGFCLFMSGKKEQLVDQLVGEMNKLAENLKFEEATRIKKTIAGLDYLTQPNRVGLYLSNPNYLEDEKTVGLEELAKILGLAKAPERIEGYDISNIQGGLATGSMVVLTNGEIDKSQYRRFKIKISGRPNDVAMHQEMMERRLKHSEWQKPDLMIIDGGRGQVRGVAEKLREVGLDIPIFGLAKAREWLYPPEGEVIKLPQRSLSLRLLQKLRDESHRFAITYHKKLRSKSFLI